MTWKDVPARLQENTKLEIILFGKVHIFRVIWHSYIKADQMDKNNNRGDICMLSISIANWDLTASPQPPYEVHTTHDEKRDLVIFVTLSTSHNSLVAQPEPPAPTLCFPTPCSPETETFKTQILLFYLIQYYLNFLPWTSIIFTERR